LHHWPRRPVSRRERGRIKKIAAGDFLPPNAAKDMIATN